MRLDKNIKNEKDSDNTSGMGDWVNYNLIFRFRVISKKRSLIFCTASEILKWQSVFLYNLGRLNDFIGQKCLKLKLRSAFVPILQNNLFQLFDTSTEYWIAFSNFMLWKSGNPLISLPSYIFMKNQLHVGTKVDLSFNLRHFRPMKLFRRSIF